MTRTGLVLTAVSAFVLCASLPTEVSAQRPNPAELKKRAAPPAARPAPPAPVARPAPPPMARPAPPPPMARPAPPPRQMPQMAAPRPAPPRIAPPRQAPPRFAAPQQIQRAAPPVARQQQREQFRAQRQERIQQQRVQQRTPPAATAPNAQRPAAAAAAAPSAVQQRIERLQQRGNLNRAQTQQLRRLQRDAARERRDVGTQAQRLERLQQQRAQGGNLSPLEQRQVRSLERTQAREQRTQDRQQRTQQRQQNQQQRQAAPANADRQAQRAARTALTADAVRQGRFAARFQDRQAQRSARLAFGVPARQAWRRGLYASFVPWAGAVYWPYAYADVFDYTFWPYAYDEAYWAYAYDDFFDGVFFPYGAPYVDYAYAGPYGDETTGSARAAPAAVPGRLTSAAREVCQDPARGVTAWPIDRIAQAVQPNADQRALLDQLKDASDEAADVFKEACPQNTPLTPPGRLSAMTARLEATLDAVKLVRPPLEKFYEALSDEQKARFNEIGPELGRKASAPREASAASGDCGGEKAGLSSLPIDRIEAAVRPTDAQQDTLDRLATAMDQAVSKLAAACPDGIPATPVGRLETMEQRLTAMIEAATIVQPALEDFYTALSNEQKAKFNRLGRDTAKAN